MKKLEMLFAAVLVLIICLTSGACNGSVETDGSDAGTSSDCTSEESTQIEGNTLTNENVAGTGWQCTYYNDDGDKIYTRFILAADGTYNQIIAINELYDHSEKGTYEVKGKALYLYQNGDTNASTVYEYKNGNLLNDGNEYTPYTE